MLRSLKSSMYSLPIVVVLDKPTVMVREWLMRNWIRMIIQVVWLMNATQKRRQFQCCDRAPRPTPLPESRAISYHQTASGML